MKYYSVAELEIIDQGWVPEYLKNVTKMVEERGGRYLARTPKVEKIEGQRKAPPIYLIIEWPSKETAMDFYECEEYRPYREKRIAGARTEFLLVAGEDIAKAAQIRE